MTTANGQVAVTGASGFIGGRVVERLHLEQLAPPKALVRASSNTARIQRFPIAVSAVDLSSRESLVSELIGCDALVHCAFDFGVAPDEMISANLATTEQLLGAAKEAGVRRLVHLSSMVVYGYPEEEIVTEQSRRAPMDVPYDRAKAEIEERVLAEADRGDLECVVLQPTIVYGPYAGGWTVSVVNRIRSGDMVLYDEGAGICNTLYIDNLVDVIISCLRSEGMSDRCFIVSDAEPTTWGAFLGHYARMLGTEITCLRPETEDQLRRSDRVYRAAYGIVRRIARAKGLQWLKRIRPAVSVGLGIARREAYTSSVLAGEPTMRCRNTFSPAEATGVLDYRPRLDLDAGMALTEAWLRWSRLVP